MTKQDIFNKYAEELGYESFEALIEDFQDIRFSSDELMKHIFNATYLVCKQALENAYQNTPEIAIRNNEWGTIKQSITNSENIPK